jgi:ATP-dependent DNA helicase DinG
VRQQVYARAQHSGGPYGLETDINPPVPRLLEAAAELDRALAKLQKPLNQLVQRLAKRLNDDADDLETPTRLRIEAMVRGLRRRSEVEVAGWRSMLQTLGKEIPRSMSIGSRSSASRGAISTSACIGTGSTRRSPSPAPWWCRRMGC